MGKDLGIHSHSVGLKLVVLNKVKIRWFVLRMFCLEPDCPGLILNDSDFYSKCLKLLELIVQTSCNWSWHFAVLKLNLYHFFFFINLVKIVPAFQSMHNFEGAAFKRYLITAVITHLGAFQMEFTHSSGTMLKCDRSDYSGIYLRIYQHSFSSLSPIRQKLIKCDCIGVIERTQLTLTSGRWQLDDVPILWTSSQAGALLGSF